MFSLVSIIILINSLNSAERFYCLLAGAQPHGNGLRLNLFITDDQHIRDLFQLGLAYFHGSSSPSCRPPGRDVHGLQLRFDLAGIFHMVSAIGMTITCTGDSQTGKAPA